MKLLFLSTLLMSVNSYSQVIDLEVYSYREQIAFEDDTFRFNPKLVDEHYIFDMTKNEMYTFQNGKKVTMEMEVVSNENGHITFYLMDVKYSSGWTLDINKKQATYFEFRPNSDYSYLVTVSKFTSK